MSRRRDVSRRVGEQNCLQGFDGETRDYFVDAFISNYTASLPTYCCYEDLKLHN